MKLNYLKYVNECMKLQGLETQFRLPRGIKIIFFADNFQNCDKNPNR